jgi:hypothetical protein
MTVNYDGKMFYTLAHGGKPNNCNEFFRTLTLENESTVVNYHSIYMTLVPRANVLKLFCPQFTNFRTKLVSVRTG